MTPSDIGEEEHLYRRIHRHFFNAESGRPSSGAFSQLEMSVDWARHTTPEASLARNNNGDHVALVSLMAQNCRNIGLAVTHDPDEENYSHSLVSGKKTDSIKNKLRNASITILPK